MWAARARHRVDFRGKLAFGDCRQHGVAARATIAHLLRRDRNRLDGVVRQVNRLDNEAGTEARLSSQMIERVIKLVVFIGALVARAHPPKCTTVPFGSLRPSRWARRSLFHSEGPARSAPRRGSAVPHLI